MWKCWNQKGKLTILDFNEAQDDKVAVVSAKPSQLFTPCCRQKPCAAPHQSAILQARCQTNIIRALTALRW